MLQIAPSGGPTSPYSVWGWRIPFFIGGLIALSFVVYFSRQVEESEVFEAEGGSDEAPIKRLLGRDTIGHFAQVFVLDDRVLADPQHRHGDPAGGPEGHGRPVGHGRRRSR